MQQSRFCVLTGHLNDYPLSDLVGILRHQQKTGRLLIEYEKGPAMFFFKNGELVDVQLDRLTGLQAICVAMGQSPASFNFNPLIKPTRRSIEPALQGTISELLGCWDENAIGLERMEPEVELLPEIDVAAQPLLSSAPHEPILEGARELAAPQMPRLLGPPPTSSQSRYSLVALTITVGGLLIVALTTLIGTSGSTTALTKAPVEASASITTKDETKPVAVKVERRSQSKREAAKATYSVATSHATANQKAVDTSSESSNAEAKKIESKSASTATSEDRVESKPEAAGTGHSVKVVLQVADGRVTRASIGNHQPGMDAYEALALRIARQRRYPAKAAAQQVITIRVNQP